MGGLQRVVASVSYFLLAVLSRFGVVSREALRRRTTWGWASHTRCASNEIFSHWHFGETGTIHALFEVRKDIPAY